MDSGFSVKGFQGLELCGFTPLTWTSPKKGTNHKGHRRAHGVSNCMARGRLGLHDVPSRQMAVV